MSNLSLSVRNTNSCVSKGVRECVGCVNIGVLGACTPKVPNHKQNTKNTKTQTTRTNYGVVLSHSTSEVQTN